MRRDELFEAYLKENILLTNEVGKMLGVSKQQVSNLVKQGKIKPFKEGANSSLFLKAEIDEYIAKKLSRNIFCQNEIIGDGNTHKSQKHFMSIKDEHKKIQEVHLYFDKQDAIFDGYYCLDGRYQRDTLLRLDAPTAVLKLCDDTELWYDGFNCGYGGTGPNGSYELLVGLGVPGEMAEKLFSAKKISFYREKNEWEVVDRTVSTARKDNPFLDGDVCLYNDRLVLVQERTEKYMLETQCVEFIDKYSFFIPRPTEVTFLSYEEALRTGHYVSSFNNSGVYQIIIKDISNSELWLSCRVDESQPISKQQNLESILKKVGMEISDTKESLPDKIKSWLGIAPVITDRITYRRTE